MIVLEYWFRESILGCKVGIECHLVPVGRIKNSSSFHERPAIICSVGYSVDLFNVAIANLANPDIVVSTVDGDTERIPVGVGPDFSLCAGVAVVGKEVPACTRRNTILPVRTIVTQWVDPQDFAVDVGQIWCIERRGIHA